MKKTILKISLVTVMLAVTSSANSVKAINAKYDHLIKIAKDAGFAYGKTAQQRVNIFNKKRDIEISKLQNRLAKSSKIKSLSKEVGSTKNKLHKASRKIEILQGKVNKKNSLLQVKGDEINHLNKIIEKSNQIVLYSLDLKKIKRLDLLTFTHDCIDSPATHVETKADILTCYQDKNELINYLSKHQIKKDNTRKDTLVKQTLTK